MYLLICCYGNKSLNTVTACISIISLPTVPDQLVHPFMCTLQLYTMASKNDKNCGNTYVMIITYGYHFPVFIVTATVSASG